MKVPFLDLKAQYDSIKDDIAHAVQEVMDSSAFSGGPFVERFEREFSDFCGSRFCIGVGSGTEALWFALLACDVGKGDEVITAPNTFMATAEAISYCGAKPVFADIEDFSYTLDVSKVEAAITPRTKAIIPVHLFGQMADMDPLQEIAAKNNISIIEDACQAHGATHKGRRAGSIGRAGAFSFYPSKNLGAYGEAGAVTTNDGKVAERIRVLRNHGQSKKYYHEEVGWNGRMDGIQAAVLSVKLKKMAQWNSQRRANAQMYCRLLDGVRGLITPKQVEERLHVYHVFSIRVKRRDALLDALTGKDIQCAIHYPVPIHLQKAYSGLGLAKGSYPISEQCADSFLSLPMFPELTSSQIEYVVESIKKAL